MHVSSQVMGIAVYSPPLDAVGNSVRAVAFFKLLMEAYPCGIFDSIVRPGQQLFGSTAPAGGEDEEDGDRVFGTWHLWRRRGTT